MMFQSLVCSIKYDCRIYEFPKPSGCSVKSIYKTYDTSSTRKIYFCLTFNTCNARPHCDSYLLQNCIPPPDQVDLSSLTFARSSSFDPEWGITRFLFPEYEGYKSPFPGPRPSRVNRLHGSVKRNELRTCGGSYTQNLNV